MMWIESIPEVAIQALGWAIFHSLWQGILIVSLLAWALGHIKEANLRYAMTLVGMGSLLLAFVASFWLEFHYLKMEQSALAITEQASSQSTIVIGYTFGESDEGISWFWGSIEAIKDRLESHIPWIVSLWIIGASLFSVRLMGGFLFLFRLSNRGILTIPEDWQAKFEQLKGQMKIDKPVLWIGSDQIEEPLTIFHLKPLILFPVGLLSGLTPSQVEAILIHELAHIRRADFLVNIIQSIIEVILFYHPAVWWISGRIRQERENCCDDYVMSCGMDPFSYAEALTHVQTFYQSSKPLLSMSALGKKGQFTARIKRLFGHYPQRSTSNKSTLAAGLLIVSLATLAFHQPILEQPIVDSPVIEGTEVYPGNLMVEEMPEQVASLPEKEETSEAAQPATVTPEELINPSLDQQTNQAVSIIITRNTSDTELDNIIRSMKNEDVKLSFKDKKRDEEGALIRLSGSIKFPDGASGSFDAMDDHSLQLSITRDWINGEWGSLEIKIGKQTETSVIIDDAEEPVIIDSKTVNGYFRISGDENDDEKKPLIIIDGERKGNDFDFENVNPKDINSINVIKGEKAREEYGDDATNGVVEIFIKEKKEKAKTDKEVRLEINGYSKKDKIVIRSKDGKNPLYVIDGKVVKDKSVLKKMKPGNIKHVTVLKDKSAKALYGNDGKDGVIVIESKSKADHVNDLKGRLKIITPSGFNSENTLVYPNEFRDDLNIEFELNKGGKVNMIIQDESGRKVGTIVTKKYPKGKNVVKWNGRRLSPGVYTIIIRNGDKTVVKKVMKE
ncbi:MAG: M56 family metallopeptidase [Bacteroidota bacterium]